MRKRKHPHSLLNCKNKLIVYYFASIILAIIATFAIVLNGADCLINIQSNSSLDRIKPASAYLGSHKKNSETFREKKEKLTFHVKENTPIGSKLADIQLVEKDLTNMMCDIIGGADQELFTLRKDFNNKLELINEVNLDYESAKKTYNIIVRVTTLYFRYDADVDILVTDENDNKPQLEDFALVFNNYKNNFPSAPVGRVPAFDADINDQLRYRVLAGNNAQLIIVNETTGDIQLSPWLNSNVPMKAVIEVAVSDGFNEAVAQLVLAVNLVTEPMLQNSVVLRLDGVGREEFLTRKYELFIKNVARILEADSMYSSNNVIIFNVEETLIDTSLESPENGVQTNTESSNSTLSINVSFSARARDGNDVENYLSSQYIEERIYLNRVQLMNSLDAFVAPFQDNLCVQEPCQNYQECHASYKFEKAKPFITTRNMIFRPIKAVQSFSCTCPPTFTGMKHKSECDLQINQCFSNPCLNGGICHRHESGYSCQCPSEFVGYNCEHSFTNSTCQELVNDSSSFKSSALCGAKSKCVNKSHFQPGRPGQQLTSIIGGFSCQGCPYPQWSTELCQLKARSFTKNSYITLTSLKRRHRFHIMLQFATVQNEALIFYNGRFNDKHDFIALEIVDTYLKFSYSLGSSVTNVTLTSIPVSDGNWHKVAVNYDNRNVSLILDDCDPVIDEALSRNQISTGRKCSNTTYGEQSSKLDYRMLDLTSPMQLGALPSLPTTFQISTLKSFVGCMSDIYIDHQLVDLYSPIQDIGTQPGCMEKRNFCQQHSCNGHPCQESWGSARCSCSEDYLGKSCDILISNEKVRRFYGNSYLSFSPIESTIPTNWMVSLHFRTMNPNGLLMKASLDSDTIILLSLYNGGLKLSHRAQNLTFNRLTLDDGEWHFIEITWQNRYTQLQIDYNPNLIVATSDFGIVSGSVIKTITLGASGPTRLSDTISLPTDTSSDFSSVVHGSAQDDFQNIYSSNTTDLQSFVGCIYGFNISDNAEQWLSTTEFRNVDRGCQVTDVCESNPCPTNSQCVRRGMSGRKCICNTGFVGEDRCIPICDLNPCQGENSKCIPVTSVSEKSWNDQATGLGYRCECEAHRSGKNCEHQLSPRCPSNWWGRPIPGGNSSICGPCNCDESKGFDGDCDKTTGQCICKSNHYQPVGSDYCLACDCYLPGSLSASCNQTSGQCKCRPGVVGRRCDTCTSPYAEVTLRGCEVIYDACPKTFVDGIWWDRTPLDKLTTQPCPSSTSTGTAKRHCTDSWQKPDMFNCISNTFTELLEKFRFFEDNKFPLNSGLAMKIASDLRLALNETITNPSNQLYGSDMYISFRLIHHLIHYEIRQTGLNLTHRQDRLYIRNLVESINYILDPAFAENWPVIASRSPNGGAEHLLRLIDSYGKVLIENQLDTFTQPFEVVTKYFTLGMDIVSPDQLWDTNKATPFGSAASSPPYATDPFSPTLHDPLGNIAGQEHSPHFNQDGTSTYLDYSLGKDSSPAIVLPKIDTSSNSHEDNTKVLIPLKTLQVKTMQELVPSPYYQAKSRAKREDLVLPVFKFIRQQPAIVVYSIFRSLGPLLPVYSDGSVMNRLGKTAESNSPVVWLTMRTANSSDFINRNLYPKINYILKVSEPSGRIRPQCAVWDFIPNGSVSNKNQSTHRLKQTGKFTTKGCEIRGIHPSHRNRYKYDYVNCSCDHLGAVTVLMDSTEYDYITSGETNTRETTILTGVSISIGVLVITLFILSCIRGHSIKSNSNSINKNLILIMLVIESLILYTVLAKNSIDVKEYQCKLVAIFLHYFSISLFFWLLVNAIHFYRMLTEIRDINHGPMKFYYVIGYAAPAFFVSIAVGLRVEHFGNYLFCWLSIREPIIWSMFGPISFASCLIVLFYMFALCRTLPVKEDPSGKELLKNHMLINIIKTPLISAHWFLTVYAVNEVLIDPVYFYPTLTVIKSIGLFIILCIVDKHIRYNLYVSYLHFRGEKVPFVEDANSQWMPTMAGEAGTFNKHYSYGAYPGQVTTPGFQSSCTDIFQPNLLALSEASTTSRSSATETSSSVYQYQYRTKESARDDAYERTRKGRHRRRHKKSHHKHHHHKHHHHHHHHRSHRHHASEEYDYDLRKRYGQVQSGVKETDSHNNLASSHSSDVDDVSTLPKKIVSSKKTDTITPNSDKTKDNSVVLAQERLDAFDGPQTVPMELPPPSTSGHQSTSKTITEEIKSSAGQEESQEKSNNL